jgi:hypothetical protein
MILHQHSHEYLLSYQSTTASSAQQKSVTLIHGNRVQEVITEKIQNTKDLSAIFLAKTPKQLLNFQKIDNGVRPSRYQAKPPKVT